MPVTNLDSLALTTGLPSASIAANVAVKARSHPMPTIATTGATEVPFRAPCAGTVTMASFVAKDPLVQHATNIITFSIRNYGQAGAGNTALLAVVDANTTKSGTGFPILAYTPFALTLHGTAANLVVAKGDILTFIATTGGTLANTVTGGLAVIEFTPS